MTFVVLFVVIYPLENLYIKFKIYLILFVEIENISIRKIYTLHLKMT
jgi:hypothetical protein